MVQRKKRLSRRREEDTPPPAMAAGPSSTREQSNAWYRQSRAAHGDGERGENARQTLKKRRNRSGQ